MNEFIEGCILGDGHLARHANARLIYNCKELEFTQLVATVLQSFNIGGTINTKPNGYGTGVTYQLSSHVSPLLTQMHDRWYQTGRKALPHDFLLTPAVANIWYCGDGGFDSDKGYLRQIKIAVHCFSMPEREFLTNELSQFGFKAKLRGGCIYISKSSIPSFLEWIGPPPTLCYEYKWRHFDYTSPQPKYRR
jgi:hypothetical protein